MKRLIYILKILLLCFTLLGAISFTSFYTYASRHYKDTLTEYSLDQTIQTLRLSTSYVPIEDISPSYLDAIVSIEDHRFFDHKGIDYIAILRALLINIKEGEIVQGGSTITQQLAKNLYLSNERTLSRKINEFFITQDLEKNYSKEDILELYANAIYFGHGNYGIGEASWAYFEKSPANLTLDESAILAAITQAPSYYTQSENTDSLLDRKQHILNILSDEYTKNMQLLGNPVVAQLH